MVSITKEGLKLRDVAKDIPLKMGSCVNLNEDEAKELYSILYKILKIYRRYYV